MHLCPVGVSCVKQKKARHAVSVHEAENVASHATDGPSKIVFKIKLFYKMCPASGPGRGHVLIYPMEAGRGGSSAPMKRASILSVEGSEPQQKKATREKDWAEEQVKANAALCSLLHLERGVQFSMRPSTKGDHADAECRQVCMTEEESLIELIDVLSGEMQPTSRAKKQAVRSTSSAQRSQDRCVRKFHLAILVLWARVQLGMHVAMESERELAESLLTIVAQNSPSFSRYKTEKAIANSVSSQVNCHRQKVETALRQGGCFQSGYNHHLRKRYLFDGIAQLSSFNRLKYVDEWTCAVNVSACHMARYNRPRDVKLSHEEIWMVLCPFADQQYKTRQTSKTCSLFVELCDAAKMEMSDFVLFMADMEPDELRKDVDGALRDLDLAYLQTAKTYKYIEEMEAPEKKPSLAVQGVVQLIRWLGLPMRRAVDGGVRCPVVPLPVEVP